MADDAPVDAGTDETTERGPALPDGGDGADPHQVSGTSSAGASVGAAGGGTTGAAVVGPPDDATAEADHSGAAPFSDPVSGTAIASPPDPATAAEHAAASVDAGDADAARAKPGGGRAATRGGTGSFWRELPVLIIIAVALAILIRTFLVQAFFIPSGSMEKTLHGCPGCSGDRVLVNKLVYDFRDPRPGDVVVFRGPPSWESEVHIAEPGNPVSRALRWVGQTIGVAQPNEKDFVKRVIAVGGQTVACCDADGRLTVDGVPLDEPYVYLSSPDSKPQEFGPVTVPKGRLWVMGDHRDGSADSRAHINDGTSGTIPVDNVIGKAFVIVWPPSRWDTLGTPGTFHNVSSGPLEIGGPLASGLVLATVPALGARRRRRGRGRD